MPDGEPDDTNEFPVYGDPVREPTSGRARTRSIVISLLVGLLVVAGTAAAILIPDRPRHVNTAGTRTTTSTAPSATSASSAAPMPSASAPVTLESLKAGQCYQVGLGDNPVDSLASCSDPHTGEVVGTADLGDKADPKRLNDLATAACGPVFAAYVGSPPEQSTYDLATIAPDEDGYRNGSHTVICLAQVETPTTGSVAGAEKSNQGQSSH